MGEQQPHGDSTLQQQRAALEARGGAERLELAVRGSRIGIWEIEMTDGTLRNGRVRLTNIGEQLEDPRITGTTDYQTLLALAHPDDAPRVEQRIEACLVGDTPDLEFVQRLRHHDGSYRWMLTRGIALRDAAGNPQRLIGSVIDITDRMQAQQALIRSEERFRRYFELGLIGMAITSPTKGCIDVNDELCRILGYDDPS